MNKCGAVLAPQEACCELCNPLHPGIFWDDAAPGPLPHVAHPSPGTPVASRLPRHGAGPGRHQAPRDGCSRGRGTLLCPQAQRGGEVGGTGPQWSPVPCGDVSRGGSSRTPPGLAGRGAGLAWRWQRGRRWDAPPRRSHVTARQKARGSLSLGAGTRARGASTVPRQTPAFRAARLGRSRSRKPASPGGEVGIAGRSGQLPAHFLPACLRAAGPCQR